MAARCTTTIAQDWAAWMAKTFLRAIFTLGPVLAEPEPFVVIGKAANPGSGRGMPIGNCVAAASATPAGSLPVIKMSTQE